MVLAKATLLQRSYGQAYCSWAVGALESRTSINPVFVHAPVRFSKRKQKFKSLVRIVAAVGGP